MSVTIADLLATLDERIPFAWAESWDVVGLLAGDADTPISGVLCSLDQTRESVDRAVAAGANVLVTHHPAFREAPQRVLAGGGPAGIVHHALTRGVALVAAHTNLDRHPEGADALPAVLGLPVCCPLERDSEPCEVVTVFCPVEAVDAVADAMSATGAGRVGRYAGASFTTTGQGRFTPLAGANPQAGSADRPDGADEVRIEAVCSPALVARVMEAVRAVHPYEEPVIVATPGSFSRGAARMGRVCEPPEGSTVGSIARLTATRLRVDPRVWGERTRAVGTVAVATGSAAAMVPHALAAGADVMVCGELRYHDALDAVSRGLAVIEAGHDATEWPLVAVLAEAVRSTPGLAAEAVRVDDATIGWHVEPREG